MEYHADAFAVYVAQIEETPYLQFDHAILERTSMLDLFRNQDQMTGFYHDKIVIPMQK